MVSLFNYIAQKLEEVMQHYDTTVTQWSQLPDDVLGLILRKLNLSDYVRCSAVSVSWRRVIVAQKPHLPSNEVPWLMLSLRGDDDDDWEEGETRRFLSLSEGRVYRINLPQFRGSRCCGSSHGWLVMVSVMPNGFIRNFLLNPFSRAQIQLPSQTTIPYRVPYRVPDKDLIVKAILSSAPTPDNVAAGNCIVVASVHIDGYKRLAFCRPGDEKWSMIKVEWSQFGNPYRDIIFYNRKLYALDLHDRLTVCEFDPHPKTIRVDIPSPIRLLNYTTIYLVESSGELLWILRICPFRSGREGVAATKGFRIFKFDASTLKWVGVKRLDHCALFLGKTHSISLAPSQYQDLNRGNCIYFAGSKNEYGHGSCTHWYCDSALFNLDDGSVKPYFPGDSGSYYKSPPVWITPNPWSGRRINPKLLIKIN